MIKEKRLGILFVCLGNICRSPLAEAIFRKKVNDLGMENLFHVDSCGTGAYHVGQQPDPRTRAVATKNGIPINHNCRQLANEDFEQYDLIIAMDQQNHENILKKGGISQTSKVIMMRSFDPAGGHEVPDPYFGAEKEFDEVFSILDRSINSMILDLKQKFQII